MLDCRNGFEGMRICNDRILWGYPMGQGILLYQRQHLMWFISCAIFIIISLMKGLE